MLAAHQCPAEDREASRRARGLADSDDPNSVDMGMQPRAGLRPPVPNEA